MIFHSLDDGIGMDQEKIDKLLDLEHKHAGYGIRNVRERLLLHYGSECDLEMESVAGVICLPYSPGVVPVYLRNIRMKGVMFG